MQGWLGFFFLLTILSLVEYEPITVLIKTIRASEMICTVQKVLRCCTSSLRLHTLFTPHTLHTCCYLSTPTSDHIPSTALPWTVNRYGSVKVDLTKAVDKGWRLKYIEDFTTVVKEHLKEWRSQGRSAVWLHIPISHSTLIPLAAETGFTLHHGQGNHVVMTMWLLDGKPNRLPPYASHQVGVCGIVYREDTKQMLVTQDKHKPPVWKFPGGLAEIGEDIADAAVREVKEETGIETEFQSILAFRQQHKLTHFFNLSDLYFLCRLTPTTFDLQPCPDELVACEWKPLSELVESDRATPMTHRLCKLMMKGRRKGMESVDIVMEEWPMIYTGWTSEKTYKLFLRSTQT